MREKITPVFSKLTSKQEYVSTIESEINSTHDLSVRKDVGQTRGIIK